MRNIDWDELRKFLVVARAGSLTKAAHQLGVSIATISRSLNNLETTIGERLFHRLPTGLSLTSVGNSVLQIAEGVESDVDGIEELVATVNRSSGRVVRITSIASVATFLARYLSSRNENQPVIEVSSSGEVLSLARREADIALRMRRYPVEGEVFVRKLCTLRFSVYASICSDPRLAPVIGFSKDCFPSEQGAWLDTLSPTVPRFRFSDMWLRYEAAASGKGSTVLPCFLGDTDPRLRRLMAPPKELDEEVLLLVHGAQRSDPDVRHAIDHISAVFRLHLQELEGTSIESKSIEQSSV